MRNVCSISGTALGLDQILPFAEVLNPNVGGSSASAEFRIRRRPRDDDQARILWGVVGDIVERNFETVENVYAQAPAAIQNYFSHLWPRQFGLFRVSHIYIASLALFSASSLRSIERPNAIIESINCSAVRRDTPGLVISSRSARS